MIASRFSKNIKLKLLDLLYEIKISEHIKYIGKQQNDNFSI
jgi:hypothetical protein